MILYYLQSEFNLLKLRKTSQFKNRENQTLEPTLK